MTTAPSASPSSLAANPVSSTQILVTWASVPRLEQNGQILGYKVSSVHGGRFVFWGLGLGVLLANRILDSQVAAEWADPEMYGGFSASPWSLSPQILLPFKLYTIDWFWNMRCSLCPWLRRNLGRGLLCTQIYCKSRIQHNRFCSITMSCRRWRGLSPCFLFTCSNRQQTLGSWRITFFFVIGIVYWPFFFFRFHLVFICLCGKYTGGWFCCEDIACACAFPVVGAV